MEEFNTMETALLHIPDLLKKAADMGVSVMYKDDAIAVRLPKDKQPDPDFLDELRNNKEGLVTYFRENNSLAGNVVREGRAYYEIMPKHVYWVDDNDQDFKRGIYIVRCFIITGHLHTGSFIKAVNYLVRRHESLRSTFHKIDGEYRMRVEDDLQAYVPGIIDMQSLKNRGIHKNDWCWFKGHEFDLQTGPLFLTRLLQVNDTEYILSIKAHHVICDEWSGEILLRDLTDAYLAYSQNREPGLPALRFQYKELIALENRYIKSNYTAHKQYWEKLHPADPGPLNIPGAKTLPGPRPRRPAQKQVFVVAKQIPTGLRMLAGRNTTSMFIVLQALLKSYLYEVSGQHDLVVGTVVFGRENMDDPARQVGDFSKMLLLRTVLDKSDSLDEIIRKVKKTNEDTGIYKACNLLDMWLQKMSKAELVNSFLKINIHYSDENGFYFSDTPSQDNSSVEELTIRDLQHPDQGEYITDQELKLHFSDYKEQMEVSILYDCDQYTDNVIRDFMNGLLEFLHRQLTMAGLLPIT